MDLLGAPRPIPRIREDLAGLARSYLAALTAEVPGGHAQEILLALAQLAHGGGLEAGVHRSCLFPVRSELQPPGVFGALRLGLRRRLMARPKTERSAAAVRESP